MKTANDWVRDIDFCVPDNELEEEIKQVQLDAIRYGLQLAVDVCIAVRMGYHTSAQEAVDIQKAIIAKRDSV